MSDNLLLSMLWAAPLAGSLLVLFIPGRNDLAVKATALGITTLTFILSIVAFVAFLGLGGTGASLADRAAVAAAEGDLIYRGEWIPYFNIQYFLGLDGISMSL